MADENLDAEFKRAFIASERRKKWGCGCLVLALILGGVIYELVRVTNETAALAPQADAQHAAPQVGSEVANLDPIELSAVVLDAMPPEGTVTLDRGKLLNDPITWSGDESDWAGSARVRVGGTRAISYRTDPPTEIGWLISVGKSDEFPNSRVISIFPISCSNDTDKDCTFSADQAFAAPGINAIALCQIPRDNGSTDYYRVTSPGRAPMIAAYDHGKGDLGSTSSLELVLAATATVPCGR